jgi:methylthioribose-1-phosphate isomerase
MRTIDWHGGKVAILDQTLLPGRERVVELHTIDELVEAITRLAVRGAPALGAAGALGVALAVRQSVREAWPAARLRREIERVRAARPTAANLSWGVDQVLPLVEAGAGPEEVERRALEVLEADAAVNRRLGERGADLLADLFERPMRLHTHCNTGALACVEWGTALGVVRSLAARGLVESVLVDETRPLLQGARLTTWELRRMGLEHRLICDGAGPAMIASGLVDAVVVGADRIAANGDVANKIGTYGLALAAHREAVPMLVIAPESTIDRTAATGAEIAVEMRDEVEVLALGGIAQAPAGTRAWNPAFDITPHDLVTAIVTEARVIRPGEGERPGERAGSGTTAEMGARDEAPRAMVGATRAGTVGATRLGTVGATRPGTVGGGRP